MQHIAAQLEPLDDDPSEFFGRLSTAVAGLVGAGRAGFFLRDGSTLSLQEKAFGIPSEILEGLQGIPISAAGGRLADRIVFQGEVFRARVGEAAAERAPYRKWVEALAARDAIVVPWGVGSVRLGMVAAADAAARDEFSEDDAWTLEVAGVAAALVWQQRRLTGQLLSEKATESDHLRGIATRMRELEEMKGHILNLAAHELRGPIAVIRGYLSLMSDGSIDEPGFRRILPILLGKAAQMDGLITQMLEVARLEEGRLELKQESVDLERATREAVDVAALLAPAGLSIFFESGTEAVVVLGDPARVTTIIGNLLDNAIKYSPNGGQVRCKVGRLDARGFVRVSDPGLGIAPGDMSRLFTRFGRIVTSENNHIPGTGLGLHLSRELARRQAGDITVESTSGRGSLFEFWLPLVESPC